MPARDRATDRTGTPGRSGAARTPAARRTGGPRAGATSPSTPAPDRLVVGPVPVLARACGLLLLLAGLAGAAAAFPTYLVVGGAAVSPVQGALDAVVALVAPVASIAVGTGLLLGRVPRFGLAYAAVTGALAVGRLLIELHRGQGSTTRPAVEVLAGELVLTSSVEIGAGWVLGVVALGLAVLAGLTAFAAWGRTVMEDGGGLDPLRPVLAGVAVLLGVAAVLTLAPPAADVPDEVVTDPLTGLEVVVQQEGPQALLERPGLALLGGLLLAGALVLSAVVAPSLRPRLAAVGGLLAVTVFLLDTALAGLRAAWSSPDLEWTVPGVGLLLLALGTGGLTLLAWRGRRGSPAQG
ncbi:hypothetical protein [Modestobacter sp. VKM Ac-2985]|uniref:hypothetical protein n=1 Tax=Modestobacter sp. VKM Ac-2985 TaxID=3004139 RepID=UPI0022AB73D6|nr:hypothetical protein [Modestobacter sp. VKM Ac-2985]MCZ2838510.1 hypothetical protein [Modestobacter sp. VKM Ac-2985]